MTGVRQVETDYQHVVEALRGAARPLTTREVAQRCGRAVAWALQRLHAANSDGLVERFETYGGYGGAASWRYVWRLCK